MKKNNIFPASETEYSDREFASLICHDDEIDSKEFYDCAFANCDFTGTVFRKCRFSDCRFENCNLSIIKIPGVSFLNTIFRNSKMVGINWTEASWPRIKLSSPIQFAGCVINDSTFFGLYLKDIRIKNCLSRDADFREADLTGADFFQTDLIDSLFCGTNLTRADFTHARNYTIRISENTLKNAKFAMPEAMSLLYCLDIKIS